MSHWLDNIKWADYCIHWQQGICTLSCTECFWSDLGGYPINQECQFHKDAHKNLTKGVKYDIILIEEERNE